MGISSGLDVRIQTGEGRAADRGEPGEIVVAGPTITSGLRERPGGELAGLFDGWFRTGDLGFLDQDGYLYLKARIKELINRGGHKVSPSDVDEILMEHPAVREAASFPGPYPTLGEDLVAAVIPRAEANGFRPTSATIASTAWSRSRSRVAYPGPTAFRRMPPAKSIVRNLPPNFPGAAESTCPAENPVEDVICRAFAACLKVTAWV